jgi:hypothetical protein
MDRNYSCPDEATMLAPPAGGARQVVLDGWRYALFCRRVGWFVLTSACNGRPSERRFRKVLITPLPRSVSVTMMNGMNVVQKMLRKIIFLPVVCV